jgi:hypothetical protein
MRGYVMHDQAEAVTAADIFLLTRKIYRRD